MVVHAHREDVFASTNELGDIQKEPRVPATMSADALAVDE